MVIYHQRDPRDLQAAYRKYCGGEMENVHVAEEDVKAAAEILDGQLGMYGDLPRDVSGLCDICNPAGRNYVDSEGKFIWVDGEIVCNFGKKHKGCKLRDMVKEDPSYLSWIAGADFSHEVRKIVTRALDGEFPEI
jgi:DNA polymerase-3 subunit epsilon